MGILDFFQRTKNSSNLPLRTWEKLLNDFWYGGQKSDSGIVVNEDNAMKFGAVSTCVSIISSDIGMLPLELRKYRNPKDRMKGSDLAINHPLYTVFMHKANNMMTSYNYKERIMSDILLSGNHYSYKELNMKGQVVALKPLYWQNMKIETDDKCNIVYKYREECSNEEKTYIPDEILHISGYGNGFIGCSPIKIKMNSIGLGLASEGFASKFYSQGLNSSGVITMPGKIRDKAGLRKELKDKYQGLQNSHVPLVLEEGMTFTKTIMPLKEAQFIETRRYQSLDIAAWYRMPPKMLQDHTYSTFSNNEQQDLDYVKHTLLPWTERLENFFSCYLLTPRDIRTGMFFRFDFETLLKPDSKTKAEIHHIQRQDGIITGNEVRHMANMNPSEVEEQNKFFINGNMVDIEKIEQQEVKNNNIPESGDEEDEKEK